MGAPVTIPVFDPQGVLRDVPQNQLPDAIRAGGTRAVLFQHPNGKARYVPENRIAEAYQNGGKVLHPYPTSQNAPPATLPADFVNWDPPQAGSPRPSSPPATLPADFVNWDQPGKITPNRTPVDYDALAAQHGGTAAWTPVDETAAKWTPVDETMGSSAVPTGTISAVHEPNSFAGKVEQWGRNVASDLKYGTDLTGIGSVLKKMGAHGVYSGNSEAVGDFMASLPLGLAKITQGGGEAGQGKLWQGTKDIAGGALQASTLPSAFVAPEGAEAVANGGQAATEAVGRAAANLNSSAMKEAAGGLLQSVAHDANKIPITLQNAGDAALKLMDWQKKTTLGPTINKFLNRITNPKLGPLTYEEARDFYQLLGNMSADEKLRLADPIKRDLAQMVSGLKTDIGNSAEQVGRAADYYKGLRDYAHASRLQEWYDAAKDVAIKAVVRGSATAGAIFTGKKIYDAAQ